MRAMNLNHKNYWPKMKQKIDKKIDNFFFNFWEQQKECKIMQHICYFFA
jgi:hypothetical protein